MFICPRDGLATPQLRYLLELRFTPGYGANHEYVNGNASSKMCSNKKLTALPSPQEMG